jgi:hypothetical protein
MKYVKILLFIFTFFLFDNVDAQALKSRIAKLGYSSYFMPFQENGHSSFHFDLESSTRNNFISNEFGAGMMSNGSDLYYMKFDYKFYPISALVNNFRYQLLYLSVGPGIYYEHLSKTENGIGLGMFTTGGLQFLVNNRISIAFELEMNFVSNLNGPLETGSNNSIGNRHFTNSFKIGYVFNR